jgi:O-antigen ligase
MMSKRLLPIYLLLIGLLLFATRDFEAATRGPVDMGNLHKIVANLIAAIFLGAFFLLKGLPEKWTPTHKLYFVFLLSGLLSSILYSSNIGYSIWKLFEVSLAFAASLYVLKISENDPQIALRFYVLLLNFLRFLLLATVIGALVLPAEAIRSPISDESIASYGSPILPYQIYGAILMVNPNSLGAIAAILFVVHVVRLMEGQSAVENAVWIFIALTFLLFSQSRTALAGLCAATVAILFLSRRISFGIKLALGFTLFAALAAFSESILLYLTRGFDTERLASLSGRLLWWGAALDQYLAASPLEKLIGLGYMTANRQILADEFDAGGAASLHSDYIDALISCGLLGAITLLVAFSLLLFRAFALARSANNALPLELLGIAIICCVRSFSGTTVSIHNMFLLVFFSVVVMLAREEHCRNLKR